MFKTCPHCKEEKEYQKITQFANHVSRCKQNPNFIKNRETNLKSIQNGCNSRDGFYKDFEVVCHHPNCQKVFTVNEREKKFPLQPYYFCSKSCSRSFSTLNDNKTETKICSCTICGVETEVNKRSTPKQVKCENCKSIEKLSSKFSTKKDKSKIVIICKFCGEKECLKTIFCLNQKLLPTLVRGFNFNLKSLGTKNYFKEWRRVIRILYKEYIVNELSPQKIATKYNLKWGNTIESLLKVLGIRTRTHVESSFIEVRLRDYSNIRSNLRYNSCYHLTWNGKTVYLRSSYELDFAKKLDKQKVLYEVEGLKIEYFDIQINRIRIAIPDFYLPLTNEIVEIKSNWTYDEQNMKDRFLAFQNLGYKTKLILEKEEYQI